MPGVARAGFARVELPAEPGVALMGYGARQGTATSVHDPLFARALYAEGAGGDRACLLIELDLCLMAVPQARAIRERLAEATGLPPDSILVGCIHTHSAPDTALIPALRGGDTPRSVQALFEAAIEAGTRAVQSAEPARMGTGSATVGIGRNRRAAGAAVEPDALVLRFDRLDGSPLAVAYVHGCHPTALGHDNLAISADWPGAATRVVEEKLPGAGAIFVLGPHADVDPRTRGLLDLAIPDQSVGVGFDEMEALGREVGEAVSRAATGIETRPGFEVACASVGVPLPVLGCEGDADARSVHRARRREAARAALGIAAVGDEAAEPTVADWYRLEAEALDGCTPAERRARASRVRLLIRDRTGPRIAGGSAPQVEAQLLRLGEAWLLGLPLEVTYDVGRAWQQATGSAGRVVSIANGWLRYLPHADHFEVPRAEECYEILNATFVPGAASALLRAGVALRDKLVARQGAPTQ